MKYQVGSIDAWGHSHATCGLDDSACKCVALDDESQTYHDTGRECVRSFDVNDVFACGTLDVDDDEPDDAQILRAMLAEYLTGETIEGYDLDDCGDGSLLTVQLRSTGEPLFQLTPIAEGDE